MVWSARDLMGAMVGGLERDAQVEPILRNRRVELGATREPGQGLAYDLATNVGVPIGSGLGIGIQGGGIKTSHRRLSLDHQGLRHGGE